MAVIQATMQPRTQALYSALGECREKSLGTRLATMLVHSTPELGILWCSCNHFCFQFQPMLLGPASRNEDLSSTPSSEINFKAKRAISPPHMPPSLVVHVVNLVRPFTQNQLNQLLSQYGTLVEGGFWINKIKSHCYVTVGNVYIYIYIYNFKFSTFNRANNRWKFYSL